MKNSQTMFSIEKISFIKSAMTPLRRTFFRLITWLQYNFVKLNSKIAGNRRWPRIRSRGIARIRPIWRHSSTSSNWRSECSTRTSICHRYCIFDSGLPVSVLLRFLAQSFLKEYPYHSHSIPSFRIQNCWSLGQKLKSFNVVSLHLVISCVCMDA